MDPLTNEDRSALSRLVIEIAWRIDHGRADTVHELFVEDGQMTLGRQTMRGRDQLQAWAAERSGLGRKTLHVCTNMRFVSTGAGRADGTTILTVYLSDGTIPATTVPFSVSEYHDTFVRTDAGWLFETRRIETAFSAPT